jgi:hypothetical protein
VCANRFLVQRGVHDAFVDRLTAAVAALKVGDGRAAGTQIGPLIDDAGLRKAEAHVADARALPRLLLVPAMRKRVIRVVNEHLPPEGALDVRRARAARNAEHSKKVVFVDGRDAVPARAAPR